MARLTTLKPRVAFARQRLVSALDTTSWRSGRTTAERGYGSRWQRARERHLSAHPLCCYCEREGLVALATIVDHIRPHRGDQTLFWDESNWQSLCPSHHSGLKQREEAQGSK